MNITYLVFNQYFFIFLTKGFANTPTELRLTENAQTRIIEDGQTRETE